MYAKTLAIIQGEAVNFLKHLCIDKFLGFE